jgi:hypothetical protein
MLCPLRSFLLRIVWIFVVYLFHLKLVNEVDLIRVIEYTVIYYLGALLTGVVFILSFTFYFFIYDKWRTAYYYNGRKRWLTFFIMLLLSSHSFLIYVFATTPFGKSALTVTSIFLGIAVVLFVLVLIKKGF